MRFRGATVIAAAALAATLAAHAQQTQQAQPAPQAALPQLAPPYVPEGTPQEQGLAGYAKILCSAVFVQGRDPVEGATNSAYWMAQTNQIPLDQITYKIDRDTKTVTATFGAITRWARFYGDQGCVLPAHGKNTIAFTPVPVKTTLPDAMTQVWPMGDKADTTPLPPEVDKARLDAAVDAAFADPTALTAGFIVVYKGHIIAERYGAGANKDTQLESWSMGKSIASTLFALLVKDGTYTLDQPAPVALWQKPGDPRAKIRNRDLLNMSGGLLFQGNQEPADARRQPYPDHYYIYTGGVDSFDYSINRPAEFPPGTVGRYRNCDPLTIGYLIKQAVTKRGETYLAWPQKVLFDKIGIRRQVIEPDPYGNFIMTGYDFGTARNWARLGLLYLQDGVWQGTRMLPEGWSKFVSTLAPGWSRPVYGGLFWINGDGGWNLPKETYLMAGAGGQNVWIDPSHQLVVVRMGQYRGSGPGRRATNNALTLLVQALENK
jgi:CubicO group peptidase (beta-lactamase class C family)